MESNIHLRALSSSRTSNRRVDSATSDEKETFVVLVNTQPVYDMTKSLQACLAKACMFHFWVPSARLSPGSSTNVS